MNTCKKYIHNNGPKAETQEIQTEKNINAETHTEEENELTK